MPRPPLPGVRHLLRIHLGGRGCVRHLRRDVLVIGVVLMVGLPGDALLQLILGGTILPAVIHGSTVVLCLVVRNGLGHNEGGFSLGRFELPVAVAALIWGIAALSVLSRPTTLVFLFSWSSD